MGRFTGIPVSILGTGVYIPEKVLTNADLEKMVDTSDQWITERTGIRERRLAGEGESTSTLSYKAAKSALDNCGVSAKDIDLILVGSCSPDAILPSIACKVQGMLGAENAAAMDIQAGCPGALFAMTVASAGIRAGMWKKVLVIGAEVISSFIDWSDRNTCVLFGDGAGACILSAGEEGVLRMLAADIKSDGNKHDYIEIRAGGTAMPATHDTVDEKEHFVKMKGQDVFKLVNKEIPAFIRKFCEESELQIADVDWWVLHQANARIIEALIRRLSIPEERAAINLDRYGNTCAASIMLLLHEMLTEGKIEPGQKVVLSSFGAGMNWGAVLLQA